jgi:hypothetical protein
MVHSATVICAAFPSIILIIRRLFCGRVGVNLGLGLVLPAAVCRINHRRHSRARLQFNSNLSTDEKRTDGGSLGEFVCENNSQMENSFVKIIHKWRNHPPQLICLAEIPFPPRAIAFVQWTRQLAPVSTRRFVQLHSSVGASWRPSPARRFVHLRSSSGRVSWRPSPRFPALHFRAFSGRFDFVFPFHFHFTSLEKSQFSFP